MLLTLSRKERYIRKVLKKLSKQRVALILQPGNVEVIEMSPAAEPGLDEALLTCHMRGWIEPICDAISMGQLTKDGQLPHPPPFPETKPIYRITEAGWNAVRLTHLWVVLTCAIAFATLIGTIAGLCIMAGKS